VTQRRAVPGSVRFWRHVVRTASGCWVWTGAIAAGTGYGIFNAGDGTLVGAHRYSWELAHPGEARTGLVVRHTCDLPPCVNPRHLVLGTYRDNTADMDARGRRRSNPRHGEDHPRAKLTVADVRTARVAWAQGVTPMDLARIFRVAESTMMALLSRRTWADV
jgi:hypothetical protein